MDAAILHAEGDDIAASAIAAKLSRLETFPAALRADAGVTLGDKLALFAVWSARAEAQGLGQALSRIASRAPGRCTVVRADGTPLPALPTGARIVAISDAASDFARGVDISRARLTPVDASAQSGFGLGGWTPGVSIGLAIYAGMFVAAGAWRSDEVSDAIANGKAVPLAGALHSFQVASVDAWSGAVQIAQAPTAAFVTPQRITVTAALDTSSIPIVAMDAVPLAVAPELASIDVSSPAPVRLPAIEPASVITVATYTALDEPLTLDASALRDTF